MIYQLSITNPATEHDDNYHDPRPNALYSTMERARAAAMATLKVDYVDCWGDPETRAAKQALIDAATWNRDNELRIESLDFYAAIYATGIDVD